MNHSFFRKQWLLLAGIAATTCTLSGCSSGESPSSSSSTTSSSTTAESTPTTSQSGTPANARDLFYQELKDSAPAATAEGTGSLNADSNSGPTKLAAAISCEVKNPEMGGATILLPPGCSIRKEGFKAGDSLRFHVRCSAQCYVYVLVQQSSNQKVALIYPPDGSDEKLESSREYVVPSHGKIQFDEKAGKEVIIIALSATPINAKSLSVPSTTLEMNELRSGQPATCGDVSLFALSNSPVPLGEVSTMREVGDKIDPYVYVDNSKDPSKALVFAFAVPHT